MSIQYNEACGTLTIQTAHSTYQMKIDENRFLMHTYYGSTVADMDLAYLHMAFDRGFSGNPDEVYPKRTFSMDILPQEYTGSGVGDYRISSISVRNADGSCGADFRYVKHEIRDGKYSLPGLPAVYDKSGKAQTLVVTVNDQVTGLTADLLYGVLEEQDVITRSVIIRNEGTEDITLEKASSMVLDLTYGDWDLIHFHGKHTYERQTERTQLTHSVQTVGSSRGTSSHQQNPFVIICDRQADEDHGSCYGCMLVYSGSFEAETELSPYDSARIVMGIQERNFSWKLKPGESFAAPEVIMAYSDSGLTDLSHKYHKVIRNQLCRGRYQHERRPILINSWEAAYFDFNEETLLKLADQAKDLGVEMLVMDDGWFGKRDDDNSSLGDWFVNESKLRGGLKKLVDQVNEKGLKFGIWVEPEGVNEESELYRMHPDWALRMPGRKPERSRNQLVLDLSRKDVRDYLFDRLSRILGENHIEYLKWDMNRSLSDVYSAALPPEREGETAHRYILGLYDLLERIGKAFPGVLIESCSGGGGRFDAGMLHYAPQVWCSDNTDPISRLNIQYGTSFGYPICTVGAHVSASPNHQTGRKTPFNTRGVVAMSGTFGYELDPSRISEEERSMIRRQISEYKQYYELIRTGRYYRLTQIGNKNYTAWEFASEDGSEALLNLVVTDPQSNPSLVHLKLKGLDPSGHYRIDRKTEEVQENSFGIFGNPDEAERYKRSDVEYTGAALMRGGYTFPWLMGDYPAIQVHFTKVR